MTSQEIYARLQESADDNKKLWALSQEFEALYRKLAKAEEQVKVVTTSAVNLEDKDGLRKAVLEHLFTESERGNAQASDKLAKLAGLGEEKQDIIIEVIDYSKAKSVNYNPPKKKSKAVGRKPKLTTTK
jgi:outer membrane PBP1 activator LpoA protein